MIEKRYQLMKRREFEGTYQRTLEAINNLAQTKAPGRLFGERDEDYDDFLAVDFFPKVETLELYKKMLEKINWGATPVFFGCYVKVPFLRNNSNLINLEILEGAVNLSKKQLDKMVLERAV
tara:strand:- start:2578 stop:2940 length:363 start_codon:yes stop_codon:yes gene_type:complete